MTMSSIVEPCPPVSQRAYAAVMDEPESTAAAAHVSQPTGRVPVGKAGRKRRARPAGQRAWSQELDHDDEVVDYPPTGDLEQQVPFWSSRAGIVARVGLVCGTLAAIVSAAIVLLAGRPGSPPVAAPVDEQVPAVAVPALALLDGTYRIDFDYAHQSTRNSPNALTWRGDNVAHYWSFSSTCTAARCIATGTRLDDTNPHQVAVPPVTDVLHRVNGVWQDQTPIRMRWPERANATDEVLCAPWVSESWTFQPRPDGTFHGALTKTIETNECGDQDATVIVPITATRTGDVPASVAQ